MVSAANLPWNLVRLDHRSQFASASRPSQQIQQACRHEFRDPFRSQDDVLKLPQSSNRSIH